MLSWLGHTSTISLSDITETVTQTTSDFVCAPDTCVNGCSSKRSLRAPARQPDPRITDTPPIPKRDIPSTPDPTWGYLDKPTTGGLDAFAGHLFSSNPTVVDLQPDEPINYSTSIFLPFGSIPFFAGVIGLYGCTSVILVSHCGVYMVSKKT